MAVNRTRAAISVVSGVRAVSGAWVEAVKLLSHQTYRRFTGPAVPRGTGIQKALSPYSPLGSATRGSG